MSSLGVSDVHIDALMADYRKADLSASELACLQFCLKLSRDAPSVCSGDIDALRACGFGDESIFEAVVVTALAVYRCTLSVGLGPEPNLDCENSRRRESFSSVAQRLAGRYPILMSRRNEKGPMCALPT